MIDIADVGSLSEGQGRTVEIHGVRLALFHVGGTYHLIDDTCPHRGASLGAGFCEQGRVYCPLHGWCFDLATGDCTSNASKPVRTHQVVTKDGKIWMVHPPGRKQEIDRGQL